jgi:catechol-2,3-dioxygenase
MTGQQTTPSAAAPAGSPPLPPVQYIHHLKFPVADLGRAVTFYEQVFGAARTKRRATRLLTAAGFQSREWHRLYAVIIQAVTATK